MGFPGQGSDLSHSCCLSHSCGSAGSNSWDGIFIPALPRHRRHQSHCTTAGTPLQVLIMQCLHIFWLSNYDFYCPISGNAAYMTCTIFALVHLRVLLVVVVGFFKIYFLFYFYFCLFAFSRATPTAHGGSQLGVQLELQQAYARATATGDPSRVCDLHHGS